MSGARERVLGVHAVTAMTEQVTQSDTGGTVRVWADDPDRKPIRCRIVPVSASNDVAMSQKELRTLYRVRFPADPGVTAVVNRLRISEHPSLAGRVLSILGEPLDAHGRGWSWQLLAEYKGKEQEETEAPSLIALPPGVGV